MLSTSRLVSFHSLLNALHLTYSTVAIAYVMQKAPYVFPVVGGRKVEHFTANMEALDIVLKPEHIAYLESIIPFDIGFPMWLIVRNCGTLS